MSAHHPVWLQRLPGDLRLRLEVAEAAAREARSQTHAHQALDLVAVLAPRMPFDDAVDRYVELMSLGGDEAEAVRTRALATLGESDLTRELARERHRTGWGLDWRYATPLGAVRFVRRQLRRSAEEDLWTELAAARAEEALVLTHVKHALVFAHLLDHHAPPPRSVTHYLNRLEVPTSRWYAVYQRALAELADILLPRLFGEAEPD
ncbi:hypothetical protein BH23GEM3_BH23GEM3_13510 [soil metagenome]|nr:hypothetical protein [Gemmatimonadota bacterium]